MSGDVGIVGVADLGGAPRERASVQQLVAEVVLDALADADVRPGDVDGVISLVPRADPLVWHGDDVAEYFGIDARLVRSVAQGGSAALLAVAEAAGAIERGMAQTVVVVGCDRLRSGLGGEGAVGAMAESGFRAWERPYAPTVPAAFALMATRHMHEYGTRAEDLAAVAVTMRRHAALHPAAERREPIDVGDVLASRLVAEPLRRLDCSLISDGGAAVVLSATTAARGVRVLGWGEGHNPAWATHWPDLTSLRSCSDSAQAAFAMADVTPGDVDVALIYDPFTIATIVALEDLGFCAKGDGGAFASSGAIGLGGELPVNPHGGLLSYAHPGRPGALLHLVEAVRQLRAEAEDRQVDGAEVALVAAEGAMLGTYATLVLGRR